MVIWEEDRTPSAEDLRRGGARLLGNGYTYTGFGRETSNYSSVSCSLRQGPILTLGQRSGAGFVLQYIPHACKTCC
jgi:hypothetical protein